MTGNMHHVHSPESLAVFAALREVVWGDRRRQGWQSDPGTFPTVSWGAPSRVGGWILLGSEIL